MSPGTRMLAAHIMRTQPRPSLWGPGVGDTPPPEVIEFNAALAAALAAFFDSEGLGPEPMARVVLTPVTASDEATLRFVAFFWGEGLARECETVGSDAVSQVKIDVVVNLDDPEPAETWMADCCRAAVRAVGAELIELWRTQGGGALH